MTYGLRIVDVDGRQFDFGAFSTNTYDTFNISSGTTGSKAYPELVGRSVYAMTQRLAGTVQSWTNYVSVTYPDGVPTVNWAPLRYGPGSSITQRVYVCVS